MLSGVEITRKCQLKAVFVSETMRAYIIFKYEMVSHIAYSHTRVASPIFNLLNIITKLIIFVFQYFTESAWDLFFKYQNYQNRNYTKNIVKNLNIQKKIQDHEIKLSLTDKDLQKMTPLQGKTLTFIVIV